MKKFQPIIFLKQTRRDSVGYSRFPHPIEGHQLSVDDNIKLEEAIEDIFGLEVLHLANPVFSPQLPSYEQKKAAYLSLFDQSLRDLLDPPREE